MSVRLTSLTMCVVVSGPISFVCIAMGIDCSSLTDIREFYFDDVLLIHINVGVLYHSLSRDFLFIVWGGGGGGRGGSIINLVFHS